MDTNIFVYETAAKFNPERKAEWSKRWHAQLNEPEPDAPIERKTGKRHIYLRLDRYVQSVIQRQLRKGEYTD